MRFSRSDTESHPEHTSPTMPSMLSISETENGELGFRASVNNKLSYLAGWSPTFNLIINISSFSLKTGDYPIERATVRKLKSVVRTVAFLVSPASLPNLREHPAGCGIVSLQQQLVSRTELYHTTCIKISAKQAQTLFLFPG